MSYQDDTWYGSGSSWLKVKNNLYLRWSVFWSKKNAISPGLCFSEHFCQVTPWGIRSLVNWVASKKTNKETQRMPVWSYLYTRRSPFTFHDTSNHYFERTDSIANTITLLYYISRSFGYRHRNPNINIREIIWLGNQLYKPLLIVDCWASNLVRYF